MRDHHVAGSADWYTPPPIIEAARQCLGGIELDPASCAAANRIVRAERYYAIDGLARDWTARTLWLNPPYGAVLPWVEKLIRSDLDRALLLTGTDGSPEWWHLAAAHADCQLVFKGRLKFWNERHAGKQTVTGSTLFAFGIEPADLHRHMGRLGTILTIAA